MIRKNKSHSMRFNLDIVLYLFFGLSGFIISYFVSPYHIQGDQFFYHKAYDLIGNLNIFEAKNQYDSNISTSEPIHFFITWIFSYIGTDKNLVMSVANGILSVLFIRFLQIKKYPLSLIFIMSFNYYIFTMYFTLERMKFAFIFLFLAIVTRKIYFQILSIFTHILTLIPIFLFNIESLLLRSNIFSSKMNNFIVYLSIALFVVFLSIFFYDHLVYRFFYYGGMASNTDGIEYWQIIIFYLISLFFSQNKIMATFYFLFLFVLVFFLGGGRLNMLGYFGMLYFSNPLNRYFQIIITIISIYFIFKAFLYIESIILYG